MTDRDLMEFLHSLESVGGSAGEEPCPADEELWAFCCGAISHSRHRAVVSHVADCGRCAARVARALPAGRQWSRNAGAIRQRLRESRARDLGRRRSARRLPLLGLLAPAGVRHTIRNRSSKPARALTIFPTTAVQRVIVEEG